MKLRENRAAGFAVVTVVYILAAALGVGVYLLLPYPFWLSLLLADVAATLFVFAFSLIFRNASVYDPYWSVQPPVILTAFAAGAQLTPVRLLLLIAVYFWSVRLTANWAYTFRGLAYQDWRYTMLGEKTGVFYPLVNLFGIHLVPTLVVYGCILPAVYAFEYNAQPNLGSAVFFLVSLGAAVMQGAADVQMHSFRKRKTGGFIRTGLWEHSRHPNYLGEILMWWGVAFSVISVMPERWYLCAGAAANTLMFLFISIPLAEGRQRRKPGFEEYKRQTNMLLPIRVKTDPAAKTVG